MLTPLMHGLYPLLLLLPFLQDAEQNNCTHYLPEGFSFTARLNDEIVSTGTRVGEPFHAYVTYDVSLFRGSPVVITKGSILVIKVDAITRAGRLKGVEKIGLSVPKIILSSLQRPFPIDGQIKEIQVRGVRVRGGLLEKQKSGWRHWLLVSLVPPLLLRRGGEIFLPRESVFEVKLLSSIEANCALPNQPGLPIVN